MKKVLDEKTREKEAAFWRELKQGAAEEVPKRCLK
jgi:hypothetical protein